jgi:hypothetical protein
MTPVPCLRCRLKVACARHPVPTVVRLARDKALPVKVLA